ncbi:MAG: hypothetical protein Q9171_002764 [Xanthocarpia ochracea]
MALATTPPILSELRSSTSSANQIAALRALKNEIIGHEEKKRIWVGLGVLAPLARILNTPKANGKRRESNCNRSTHHGKTAFGRTDEEEARLQAIIVVGSLASGGPAFIPSIRASAVISPLLSLLSTSESSANLVLAALRTLNTIANASTLECFDNQDRSRGLIRSLYSDENLVNIKHIILQPFASNLVHHQISLAAALIARTCQDESQRNLLVQAGVLDALASRLSFLIDATDYVSCYSQSAHGPSSALEASHAVAQSWLAPVLAAIGTIVDTSRQRSTRLLSTPVLTAVLSRFGADIEVPHDKKASPWPHQSSTPSVARLSSTSRLDYLLPQLPNFSVKRSLPETNHHPPIGSRGTLARQPSSTKAFNHAYETSDGRVSVSPPQEESPLVAWLIYIARAESGITRLMAAWLIGLFYASGLIDKRRDISCAMLLVPLLVRMLDKEVKSTTQDDLIYNINSLRSAMPNPQIQAPAILAMLTLDSLELQRAAVDAGAIKKLAKLLKESYEPVPTRIESQWTTDPQLENSLDSSHENVGNQDFTTTATTYQMLKLRESALKALASIASISDDYRKTIIENGVVPFVIESLKPKLELPITEESTQTKPDAGHARSPSHLSSPIGVLVAACATAKSLTRSVSTLRTSLMDAGLAGPLFVLLEHPDVRVQIAATEVVSNLVLEFSPMREVTLDAEIHRVLCDHAHSSDSSLRFNSVWAVAHLVSSAPKSLKKDCLSNLGPEWLLQIICNDGTDAGDANMSMSTSTSTPIAMGTPNAAGEQVDILNATDGSEEDSQGANEDEDDEMTESDSQRQLPHNSPWRSVGKQVVSGSTNERHIDEVAIQKQGLDFIRNLICGSDAAEMIDYLFEQFGQDKLFEMLISKLRPRLINAFNRDRRSSEKVVRQAQPQTDIINTVVYTINNMAAGSPRQRYVVVSHPELLKLIVTLFSHPNCEVRAGCAWIVINLTWREDQSDHANCKQRISQLGKLGVLEKLKKLEDDPELDVRERAKTAVYQMTYFDREVIGRY